MFPRVLSGVWKVVSFHKATFLPSRGLNGQITRTANA